VLHGSGPPCLAVWRHHDIGGPCSCTETRCSPWKGRLCTVARSTAGSTSTTSFQPCLLIRRCHERASASRGYHLGRVHVRERASLMGRGLLQVVADWYVLALSEVMLGVCRCDLCARSVQSCAESTQRLCCSHRLVLILLLADGGALPLSRRAAAVDA